MNYEEARDYMKGKRERAFSAEPYDLAIEALEKQIPKMPLYSDYEDDGDDRLIATKATCPACGNEFEFGTWNAEENHHCDCGQAIDWRE